MKKHQNTFRKQSIIVVLVLAGVALSASSVYAATEEDPATADATKNQPQYVLIDGKVDKATFNGYRRFHGTCHACHGQDAMGGSFAPALAESLKTLSYDVFKKTVVEGRQSTSASGTASAMPSFGQDPNITKHLDDIYRYLRARAVGGLAPGRPAKLPKKK